MSTKITDDEGAAKPAGRKDRHLLESTHQFLEAKRVFELYQQHQNDLMLLAAFDAIESAAREALAITGPADPLRRGRAALHDEIRKAMVSHAESVLRHGARNIAAGERLIREDLIVDKMGAEYLYLQHLQKKAASGAEFSRPLPSSVARQVRLRVVKASQGAFSEAAIVRAWSEAFLLGTAGLPWRNLVEEVERHGKELKQRATSSATRAHDKATSGTAWRDVERLDFSKKRSR